MRIFKNRIILSLFVVLAGTYFWEFYVKPITGPLYTAAVSEYKNSNYEGSLDLLHRAYRIDPNDTAILTLIGWDYLKLRDARTAEKYFQRAQRLAPAISDLLLGYIYTEIQLQKYDEAQRLLAIL